MDDNTNKQPGCFSTIIGIFILLAIISGIVKGCNSNTKPVSTTTVVPSSSQTTAYNVSIAVTYERHLISSNPICDIYIDDKKVAEAQATGSEKTISATLEGGEHSIRIKTSDWGLVHGSQTNSVNFTVSGDDAYRFAYKRTLTKFELWDEDSNITVN